MMTQMLMGASRGSIVSPLPITELEDGEVDPTDASCSVQLNTDGSITLTGNATIGGFNWFNPSYPGIGNQYWGRMTKNSGSDNTSGSSLGVWLALSTARGWTWVRTTVGSITANVTLEISSDSGGSVIVSSATFNATSAVEV